MTDDLDFVSCLLLYSHRRDEALGINWHSAQTRNLLWYYLYLQQQSLVTNIVVKPFYYGILQSAQERISEIVNSVTADMPKEKIIELGLEAKRLKDIVDKSYQVING